MLSKLPAELVDNVLDHLHDDDWYEGLDTRYAGEVRGKPDSDLAVCSLVSRAWNALACRHLFRDVVYSFQRVPQATEAIFDANGKYSSSHSQYGRWSAEIDIRYKTFPMFCSFIRTSPAIRPFIRRLKLDGYPEQTGVVLFGQYTLDDCVELELFLELLQSLPQLSFLHLCNVVLDRRPDETLRITAGLSLSCLSISYHVERGDVCYWYWRSWPEDADSGERVADILDCFTDVVQLRVLDCGEPDRSLQFKRKRRPFSPLGLQALILGVRSMFVTGTLDHLMRSPPVMASLQSLTLDDSLGWSVAAADLLRLVGPQLQELRYFVEQSSQDRTSTFNACGPS